MEILSKKKKKVRERKLFEYEVCHQQSLLFIKKPHCRYFQVFDNRAQKIRVILK